MIPEILTIVTSVTGGGIFLSRWVDGVSERLDKIEAGQSDIREHITDMRERITRVEDRLPNGELKQLVGDVQGIKDLLNDRRS
jgi:hypothetical protein